MNRIVPLGSANYRIGTIIEILTWKISLVRVTISKYTEQKIYWKEKREYQAKKVKVKEWLTDRYEKVDKNFISSL